MVETDNVLNVEAGGRGPDPNHEDDEHILPNMYCT
jgi:hypothetical protein